MIEFNREKQTIDFYQDIENKNINLQKEIVDYVLDLPEDVALPKRNFDNHSRKRWQDVLNPEDEDYAPHFSERIQEYDEYLEAFKSRNWENKYSWDSRFFTVSVSVDCVFFLEWHKLKANEDLSEINFCNELGQLKKINLKEYCYLIDKKIRVEEENKNEKSNEVKSVTNIFNATTNIGNLGDYGKIEGFKIINDEVSKLKTNSGLSVEEIKAVKKWKSLALFGFFVYFLISIFLIYCYTQEVNFIMEKEDWTDFKGKDFSKIIITVWSFLGVYLFYKLIYDRFFDPSKEKAFIDLYKIRKKD